LYYCVAEEDEGGTSPYVAVCLKDEDTVEICKLMAGISEAIYEIDLLKCLVTSIAKTARELVCFLYILDSATESFRKLSEDQ
jgi:hypothetical protein